MKIFRFDPTTGTRGEHIADWRRASWTDARWNEYDGHAPVGFGSDAEVTVHHDAGITDATGAKDISYRHPTEWIAFCLGCWRVGVNDDGTPDEHWEWVVVPPKTVRTRPTPGCVRCEKTLDGFRHQYGCLPGNETR